MYTHVIFDLDGTLLNTIDDLADAGNCVCRAHGWPTHTVDQFKLMVGNGIPNLVARFTPVGLSQEELTAVLEEFSAYYNAHKADKTAPYAGVPKAVAALKAAGVTLAVLSNKADALAGPVVEQYYPGVFERVQGALPGVPVKPDPTLLGRLMDKLGTDREHTLFVGDSSVDIQTGKNGGLDTCGVLWGFRSRQELEEAGADDIIACPAQLVSLVTGTELLGPDQIGQAAEMLRQGKLVAVPTETVYGLAADATQERAVQANYEAKGRPETKPLNVLVDSMAMVEQVCKGIPPDAYRLAEAFWPGPLTMILLGNGALPGIVPAGGATQGVRCPDHPDTLSVIRALGRPLACPSANLSGQPSPKSAGDVLGQLAGRIDGVLDGGPCSVGVESTILDLTATPYRVLRQGGLSREAIEAVLGETAMDGTSEGKKQNLNIKVKNCVAIIYEPAVLVADGSSAMDLLAAVRYETGCSAMLLHKEQLDEAFFRLSSGLAGEVLQKFVNYQMRLGVVGDFSSYTSKPLHDFIYESNLGKQVCFLPTEEEALTWLERE